MFNLNDPELNDYFIAKKLSTSIKTLIELSKNEDWCIRAAIAKNPNTPIEILVELSKDEVYSVRWRLAENPNTPIEVLIELTKDKNEYVNICAQQIRMRRLHLLK